MPPIIKLRLGPFARELAKGAGSGSLGIGVDCGESKLPLDGGDVDAYDDGAQVEISEKLSMSSRVEGANNLSPLSLVSPDWPDNDGKTGLILAVIVMGPADVHAMLKGLPACTCRTPAQPASHTKPAFQNPGFKTGNRRNSSSVIGCLSK